MTVFVEVFLFYLFPIKFVTCRGVNNLKYTQGELPLFKNIIGQWHKIKYLVIFHNIVFPVFGSLIVPGNLCSFINVSSEPLILPFALLSSQKIKYLVYRGHFNILRQWETELLHQLPGVPYGIPPTVAASKFLASHSNKLKPSGLVLSLWSSQNS